MSRFIRAVILILFFLSLAENGFAYIREQPKSRPQNHVFNKWMAELVDKEKSRLGGLALRIPTSLAVSQAKLESNNGKSKYARKWNNYFGLYGENKRKQKRIMRFNRPEECVRFYLKNLMAHEGYGGFRLALRQGVDDPAVLIRKVARVYAEDPDYQRKVVSILRKDNLAVFDGGSSSATSFTRGFSSPGFFMLGLTFGEKSYIGKNNKKYSMRAKNESLNAPVSNTGKLGLLRQRIGEVVYRLITGTALSKTVSNLDKARVVKEYIKDFEDDLKNILINLNGQIHENDEAFYHEIIHQSLDLLITKLKMDYVGIWLVTEDRFHPIHQAGISKTLNHRLIYDQILEAEEICSNSGKNFCLFPSESKKGGVDSVFIFKNLKEKTVGYLLLDEISDKRELTNFEIEKICDIFHSRLDKLIIEYELSRVNIENIIIKKKLEEVISLSRIDPLTSLLNRRTGDEIFAQRLADIARGSTNVCIALIDIDDFKKVNDAHGHLIGDEVLKKIAEILNIGYSKDEKILHIRRSTDDFVRFGGEELLCILNHTNLKQAMVYLNKIREIISQMRFTGTDGSPFKVTISAGITDITKDDADYKNSYPLEVKISNITARADCALYEAKKAGKNTIRVTIGNMPGC